MKSYDAKMVKSLFFGFYIWLIAISMAYILDFKVSYEINISGGFITMLFVWILINSDEKVG